MNINESGRSKENVHTPKKYTLKQTLNSEEKNSSKRRTKFKAKQPYVSVSGKHPSYEWKRDTTPNCPP